MSTPTEAGQYQDTRIDVKLVLSALWIAMLIVFAYGDIFGLFRADVLRAALDRKMATTGTTVDQVFLVFTTVYILIPTLMVFLSLVLRPRVNRIVNIVVALVYAVSIVASCIGEGWAYYLLGSAVEVVLLAAIVRTAWTWPRTQVAPATR
jgi:glucan phosphoethanolaminetransferase (alkaline phosphatase superfamily)